MQILLTLSILAPCAALLFPPIGQDPAYHSFADQREWLGIPNAANVLSNIPFLVVGLMGYREVWTGQATGIVREFRIAYLAFFVGIAAISVGSAYYHLHPDNARLVWDRLPMTVAFMAFAAIVAAEHLSLALGRLLFLPLQAIGMFSVFYWYLTESSGHGDLRFYGLVQFLPLMLLPLVIAWFPSRLSDPVYLWVLLAGYVLAKLAEFFDGQIFNMLVGLISGHTIKHLIAAGATGMFLLAVRHRRALPLAGDSGGSAVYPGPAPNPLDDPEAVPKRRVDSV